MSTMIKNTPQFDQLRNWISEVNGTKQAAEKKAEKGLGQTSHPSKSVDDGTEKATEGFFGKELSKDVEKMVPANVDGVKTVGQDQEKVQLEIGTKKTPTGEQPSVEDDYKDRPKDSPTSLPADAAIGEKYSFDFSTPAGLKQACAALQNLSNEILADIAVGAGVAPKQANAAKVETPVSEPASKSASSPSAAEVSASPAGASVPSTPASAAQAGYELAGMLGLSKDAADKTAAQTIEGVIQQALYLGDRVGQKLQALYQKQAMGGGELPPGAGDEPDKPKTSPEDAAAAGPDGAGGPVPAGPEGPPPPMMAGPEGAPPPGPGAGPDMGGMGGGMGGGGAGASPQAIQELAMALMELGGPQVLQQLAQAAQGAEGAGMAPPGAGDMGGKIASAVNEHMRSGKFEFTEAKKGSAARKLRDEMKNHVREVLSRK